VLCGSGWRVGVRLRSLRRAGDPPRPDNSSVPPSRGQKPNRDKKPKREDLGLQRGRKVAGDRCRGADQTSLPKPRVAATAGRPGDGDQVLHGRYDKIDLPPVAPCDTVERYAGAVPVARDDGARSRGLEAVRRSPRIVATALYLRFVHAISYQRLSRLFLHLFGLR